MLQRLLTITFIAASLLVFTNCERDEDVQGPAYESAPSDLSIVKDSLGVFNNTSNLNQITAIDFTDDSVYISAELSTSTTWRITITGTESGAEKIITDNSKAIDKVVWTGASDNDFFFKQGELVSIKLSFLGIDLNTEVFITITKAKLFDNVVLLADFEVFGTAQGLVLPGAPPEGDPDGWFDFFDPGEVISNGVGPSNITIERPSLASTPVVSIQGDGYYHMRGQDDPLKPGAFFIGGTGHDPISYGLTGSAEETFINFYANPNGSTTTKLVVELAGVGGDLFVKEINVDWDGWQLISVKLSDFALGTAGDIGLGEIRPELLKEMKFAIHSGGTAGNLAEINIDYITFTEGVPFKQQ